MKSFVSQAVATGEEIHKIVSAIEPILVNVDRAHIIIACLSIALTVSKPDITPEQLQAAVRDTSQYICMILEEVDPSTPQERMN